MRRAARSRSSLPARTRWSSDRKGRRVLVQRSGSEEARARNEDEAAGYGPPRRPKRGYHGKRDLSRGMSKSMRVVGGRLKGRNIAAPSSRDIRPTADRLRESVFNILVHAYDDPIDGARVLDLFAGTGALGIEAVSRGAAFALFVDNGAEARALLRNNVEALGARRRHQGLSPRRHRSRPGASDRAVLAGVPRSALWQGAGGEGAGLAARRRLADAGRAAGGGGGEGGGVRRAGWFRGAGAARL